MPNLSDSGTGTVAEVGVTDGQSDSTETLSVFLLCAGTGERWNDHLGVPKHLIRFGGESLLQRTARLVRLLRPCRLLCVARDARISIDTAERIDVHQSSCLPATIALTRPYWTEQNVMLLGDVFFSQACLKVALGQYDGLRFIGRPWPSERVKCGHGEMFALSFRGREGPNLLRLVENVQVEWAEPAPNLWNLYQFAAGLPRRSTDVAPGLLLAVDDYTNDIDTPVDHERRRVLYEAISVGEQAAGP